MLNKVWAKQKFKNPKRNLKKLSLDLDLWENLNLGQEKDQIEEEAKV